MGLGRARVGRGRSRLCFSGDRAALLFAIRMAFSLGEEWDGVWIDA